MRFAAAALLAVAFGRAGAQDPDEIDRQFGRISAKEPRATFDAIARLVALSEKARERIEKQATKLGEDCAFYRTVLLEELKTKDALGARYGKEQRVSIAAAGKSVVEILADLQQKSGIMIDPGPNLRKNPGNPIDMKMEDVAPLDALLEVCRQAKLTPRRSNNEWLTFSPHSGAELAFRYRNFVVLPNYIARTNTIDFAGPARRTVSVWLDVFWDRGVDAVHVGTEPAVLEAVDAAGKALEPVDPQVAAELSEEDEDPSRFGVCAGSQVPFHFKEPVGDKIALLRGHVTVHLPSAISELKLADLSPGAKREDEHFEVALVRMEAFNVMVVRVRPKSGSLDSLRAMPARFSVTRKGGSVRPGWFTAKAINDKEVEYRVCPAATSDDAASGQMTDASALTLTIYRTTTPRRLYFELRDLPVK